MAKDRRVFVIVPAYEEAEHIVATLRGMPESVHSVVVVDDASVDDTAARAEALGDPRVTVLRHAENRGVGAAIATGYRHVLGQGGAADDALVVMAGDGQMNPADLPNLLAALDAADYVKGTRMRHEQLLARMPLQRWLGSQVLSGATSWALGERIEDSQCGYTAITRHAAAALDLDDLWPRFGYPNDLLGQLVVRGLRVAEVPVEPIYAGEVSHLRAWHVPRIAWLIGRAAVRVRSAKLQAQLKAVRRG